METVVVRDAFVLKTVILGIKGVNVVRVLVDDVGVDAVAKLESLMVADIVVRSDAGDVWLTLSFVAFGDNVVPEL